MNTFDDYEQVAVSTAIYPECGEKTRIALAYTALGLAGEAGEYAEKVKKYIRDGTLNKELMVKELGDVLWYITACGNELGFSLQDIAQLNINKLAARKQAGVLQGSGDTR